MAVSKEFKTVHYRRRKSNNQNQAGNEFKSYQETKQRLEIS